MKHELKFIGKATARVGKFGKFSPGMGIGGVSDADTKILLDTGQFKDVTPKPKAKSKKD